MKIHKMILWSIALLVAIGLLAGCGGKEPILVGYSGELTGPQSEVGVDGRDGALLAVEAINQQGGIAGREVTLLVKDDTGEPDSARKADADLVEAGVVAVIGHMTSGQTAAVFQQMNDAGVVLLSPTASSEGFSGQADYFFRIIASTTSQAKTLAYHIFHNRDITHIIGVYDTDNQAYAGVLWDALQADFESMGGTVDATFPFSSSSADLQHLADDIAAQSPTAVVMAVSAIDAARLSQYLRQNGVDAPLFGTAWSMTNVLLAKGGRAIDGLEVTSIFHPHNPYPGFAPFAQAFEARYHRPPSFAAAYGYEAVLVLAEGLKQTGGTADGLPEALTAVQRMPGVQGEISIDSYGDVQRDAYIAAVKNHQFEVIDIIPPLDP